MKDKCFALKKQTKHDSFLKESFISFKKFFTLIA